jgi:hypothetical protein
MSEQNILHFINCHFLMFVMKQGLNCCSTHAVSFHYTSGYKALELEYFLYHLKIATNSDRPNN